MSLFDQLLPLVAHCMAAHDPSHNPAHVHRVVALARSLLAAERESASAVSYDPTVVDLAALLHDIADHKYLSTVTATIATLPVSSSASAALAPHNLVRELLRAHGADPRLADRVQTIVSHVSYSVERADPPTVRRLIDHGYPELAIVQDADRLDAIGAVGIARCFTFLGAKGRDFVPAGAAWDMDNALQHFSDKLEKLESLMKTPAGRRMARERTARLVEFRRWWDEEMQLLA
ncbi:hypothetical protein BDV59DRAFT_203684 [Aspergillus ambiguus]|uniref:HD domain-containing protein n=1 Tax=Aspergillus ambiguus TaxID=176160 RepID=UPI003CCDD861